MGVLQGEQTENGEGEIHEGKGISKRKALVNKLFLMQRFFDIILTFSGLLILSPLLLVLYITGLVYSGSPLFIQTRIGRHQKPFKLVKFRTMKREAASMGTHLINPNVITPYGRILRASKLDELPQLWNVLIGDMSLVGPRPNLPNQNELISERSLRSVYSVRPGITGLAQIKKIDMSTPNILAETDAKMIDGFSLTTYFSVLLLTVTGKGFGDRVHKNKDEGRA